MTSGYGRGTWGSGYYSEPIGAKGGGEGEGGGEGDG